MIIWIASYPKSGNTWVRALLSAIMYSKDGKFEFELLENIPQFPHRTHFSSFTKDYFNIQEISKYWTIAQDKLNLDNKVKLLKTHHARCIYMEREFTNTENTLATIYIVRDPRNVITSISNYFLRSIGNSKDFLFSSTRHLGNKKDRPTDENFYTVLGNWADHYNSWKKFNINNLLIVKYEDLLKDAKSKVVQILKFLSNYSKIEYSDKKIDNALNTTNFENLKTMEKQIGFIKQSLHGKINKKINFFNLGKNNDWRKILDKDIANQISKKFEKEMKELNYLN